MPSTKKPIQDVAKPGDTPADATSRPVIVNRNSMIKDPMVTEPEPATEQPPEEKLAGESTVEPKKVIKPLTKDKPETTTGEDTGKASATEAQEATKTDSDDVSDSAVVDAVLDQVAENKQQAVDDAEAKQRQELVDKLVQEKKYFVPLATAQHRRNNKIALIMVGALVPLVVGILLAIDADVIDIGIDLPFDLIK